MREQLLSRRVLLHGGAAFGLTAVTTAVATGVTTAAFAPTAGASPRRPAMTTQSGHLKLDYRPSRPHGWGAGSTIGGHLPSQEFVQDGQRYRVGLLPFGQPGDAPHPVYEDEPSDPEIDFKAALAAAFGDLYALRYLGFDGRRELTVHSYSVYTQQAPEPSLAISFGADLYVVYEPGRHGPPISDDLHWIQVVRSVGPPVDNIGRANPFYVTGGRTSIYGHEVCNFYDRPGLDLGGPDSAPQFMAESFLARNTGRKDAAGREIVDVHGGLKWGWHAHQI